MNAKGWKKALAFVTALSLCLYGTNINRSSVQTNVSAAENMESRFVVDLNANDGRKASYAKNAENWNVPGGSSAETTINGVTFKLSAADGGSIKSQNNKKLQLQSGIYPRMTMDGVRTDGGSGTSSLKLEISGLSNGSHTIRTWHATPDYNSPCGSVSLTVNGNKAMSGISVPANPTDEDNAGIGFAQFSGTSATIIITSENNGSGQNFAWLNAFEIDASDPINGVSNLTPDNGEKHFDSLQPLSWTAGKGAKSHNVYIGTDYAKVMNADTNSAEFKGNQSGTTFMLDDTYSSIPTYYWRVDEVTNNGIVKGSVNSFCIRRDAFQTAEGYGRYARGGRGGYVYHVTNLNDSGEGSLRYGLETLKGARTVVFNVGGVIELSKVLCIPDDGGDVYVAGQTAPGDGITLINYDFGAMGASDVVIRDIRTRVGDMNGKSTGGMGLGSCNYSIVDHCSISWATDEGFSSRSAQNISFQWNIIAESLNESVHYDANDRTKTEPHSFAASISGYTGSFHHNLLVNNTGRNVSLAGAMEQDAQTYGGQLDFRNNVIYNWRDRTTDGGVRRLQFVNNYYKAGAVSNTNLHVVSLDGNELGTYDMQKMYVSGNKMTDSKGNAILNSNDDAWAKGKAKSGGKNSTDADVRSDTPFFESYVNTQSADDAYNSVISAAGANKPGYDYLDSRYIKEVTNGTYTYTGSKAGLKGIIDSQNDVGGYPNSSNFKGGTAPKDTDGDGMSDAWETEHGLNPNDASDGSIVSLSADDYTNLEMYLNELAGDPVEYNEIVETISAFETIEAEGFSSQEGVRIEDLASGGQNIGFIENGDWIMFKNVDFEDGAKSLKARISGNASGIELYLGSMSGTPAAKIDFAGTSGFGDYQEVQFNIPKISGINNLYIRFTGGNGYLLNIDSFVFSKNTAPISGELIKDLTVFDTENASDWLISSAASDDSLVFGDREVTYTDIPSALKNSEYIRTACDSKNFTDKLAEFTAGADMTVYIALDNRVEKTPSWMSGFTKTNMTVSNSSNVVFDIYSKAVKKGEKITLGSNGQSSGCVNYTVFAKTSSKVIGDVNADGELTIADAVMMQKWLLAVPDATLTDWKAGNLCEDDRIDVFDLCLMKQLLVESAEK